VAGHSRLLEGAGVEVKRASKKRSDGEEVVWQREQKIWRENEKMNQGRLLTDLCSNSKIHHWRRDELRTRSSFKQCCWRRLSKVRSCWCVRLDNNKWIIQV
jgi:hypothetical protein